MILKWIFDRVGALFGIALLLPLFAVLALWISFDSPGGPFFIQKRVGKNGRLFGLVKFRSMRPDSEKKGKLTVGDRDPRVTRAGYFLRKYKLDELPQLFNVLKGDMSFVGPRPEVPEYVALYDQQQREVLNWKPGITDKASLKYFNENEILARSDNPKQTYIDVVMPAKLEINLTYLRERTFFSDVKVIFQTIGRIFQEGSD